MSVTKQDVFEYHSKGRPGKIEVVPSKPLRTQRDLSLAYTPGVAEAVLEVERDPLTAYQLTAKSNLVAVVSNGTSILGLGDRGPLASKPVMEGKGVLFKRFADIDVFDIEIDAHTVEEVVSAVRAIAPTFGGINLEDIKSPECFEIETILRGELDIPVFHDDQHGTAIISSAALINACRLTGRRLLHLLVDLAGIDIQRAPEDEWEAEDVVNLIRVIAAASRNQGVGPGFAGQFRHDLRVGVGQRENDRVGSHPLEVLWLQHVGRRQAEEHIGAFNRVHQRAGRLAFGVNVLV